MRDVEEVVGDERGARVGDRGWQPGADEVAVLGVRLLEEVDQRLLGSDPDESPAFLDGVWLGCDVEVLVNGPGAAEQRRLDRQLAGQRQRMPGSLQLFVHIGGQVDRVGTVVGALDPDRAVLLLDRGAGQAGPRRDRRCVAERGDGHARPIGGELPAVVGTPQDTLIKRGGGERHEAVRAVIGEGHRRPTVVHPEHDHRHAVDDHRPWPRRHFLGAADPDPLLAFHQVSVLQPAVPGKNEAHDASSSERHAGRWCRDPGARLRHLADHR
jgi:hypothetical protein